jgi:UDP-hydrolysing UDP-N-acetyl-D-glucosamine 2-epimerase
MTESPLLEVVITARPSWARVKSLVAHYSSMAGSSRVRISLVGPAVSKRYGDITSQIDDNLDVKIFSTLHEADDFAGVALTCIEGASSLVHYWSHSRPDCVLVIADRTETLGVAVAASLMQIPLIHLQGGEITGSIDDKIRDANTKLADFHLTTNAFTRGRILSMGEDENRVFSVGCPSIDLVSETINLAQKPIDFEKSTAEIIGGTGSVFPLSDDYGIIMFHPDTTEEEESLRWVIEIKKLTESNLLNWFWFWPNPDHGSHAISKQIRLLRESNISDRIRFIINVEPEIFILLASNARIMIGNSSFGIREASFIGLPALNLGSRQNGRQRAKNVTDLSLGNDLTETVKNTLKVPRPVASDLYGDGTAGYKAAKVISQWIPKIKSRS